MAKIRTYNNFRGVILSLLSMSLLFAGCTTPGGTAEKVVPAAQTKIVVPRAAYAIMQGVTGPNWTRLSILRQRNENLTYIVERGPDDILPKKNLRLTTHDYAASDAVVDELMIQGFLPADQLRLRVEKEGKIVDQRSFAGRSGRGGVKFALVSCSDDFYQEAQAAMWNHLAAQKPDVIFTIGDNVYGDVENHQWKGDATPDLLWRRYVQTRENLEIFRQSQLIPIIAVWDDHDYGQNDGDRRYQFKKQSLEIFHSFFPQSTGFERFHHGPAAASSYSWGEQRFVLLDDRSFRSPNQPSPICQAKAGHPLCRPRPMPDRGADNPKSEPHTHFGYKQTQWALREIDDARSDVVWLISGDQWFGAYSPFESFEGNHPKDFAQFMKSIRDLTNSRVAFLSGDRHSTEITEVEASLLGYETFEVVSSPIHSGVHPSNWGEFPNPRQIQAFAGSFNYVVFDSQVKDENWTIQAKNFVYNAQTKSVDAGFVKDLKVVRPVAE